MASKRRLRRKACGTKKRFATQDDAAHEVSRRVAKTQGAMGGKLLPYHCQFCGGYHIGHPPANVKQSIEARKGKGF